MSTARKMRAPRTEPAMAPTFDLGVAGTAEEALGEELEVEVEVEVDPEAGVVEDGDWSVMQDESPDKATLVR
jgi:hypothetical protein